MYIQENQGVGIPFTVPKGYSGNAFPETSPAVTPQEVIPQAPSPEDVPQEPEADAAPTVADAPSTLAGAFGKLPFLSSLLPPPRRKKEGGGLPEWALLALILFVLNDSREGDLLPILLLLLLWD